MSMTMSLFNEPRLKHPICEYVDVLFGAKLAHDNNWFLACLIAS